LAQALKQGYCVFTTNYDNLIEKACEKIGLNVDGEGRRCYTNKHFTQFVEEYLKRGKKFGGFLFKLHGSIEDIQSILDTLTEVGKGLSEPKKEVLQYFSQNFNFVFIGYSCRDDFDVFPELLKMPSERGVCWFSYMKDGLGAIIFSKRIIELEYKQEKNKPLGVPKNWETINVNELLLSRRNSIKVICNPSEFVRGMVMVFYKCEFTKRDILEDEEIKKQFASLVKNIDEYHKYLIAGRLFHYLEIFDKAEKYFKKAENSTQKEEEKAIAQKWQADTYYRWEIYRKAIEILTQKTLPYYERMGDTFGIVRVSIDVANSLRRLRDFSAALKYLERAKDLLERNREEFKEKEQFNLEYGKCLNILGLTLMGEGDSKKDLQKIQKGLEFCERGREIREFTGDKSSVADSENAIGLILCIIAGYLKLSDRERAFQLMMSDREIVVNGLTLKGGALKYLKDALDKKERTGDYRGSQLILRNLALSHDLLGEIVPEEYRKHCLQAAGYLRETLDYIERMPNPPLDRYLDTQFWLGVEYKKAECYREAVEVLKTVVEWRDKTKDWHNKARALNELKECYEKMNEKENCINCCDEIKKIYESVLEDANKLEEIKKIEIKFRNAIEKILPSTEETLRRLGLESVAKQVSGVIHQLKLAKEGANKNKES
jgi:tetratricopeptide (TPR) repeat protein